MALYSDLIREHHRFPQNFGSLSNKTHLAEAVNPVCGDNCRVELSVSREGRIEDIAFSASGCAISRAATSILTSEVKGMTQTEVQKAFDLYQKSLEGQDATGLSLNLTALAQVRDFPLRVKCATLAFRTVLSAFASPVAKK